MSRLKYSIVLFAVLTGGFSSFSILIEDITLFEIWIIPIGIVIAMNAHHTQTEVAAELSSIKSASLWAVTAILLAFPVVVTHRMLESESIGSDLGWIILPGFLVIVFFDTISKLIERARSIY